MSPANQMPRFALDAFEEWCDEAIKAIGYDNAWLILQQRRDRRLIENVANSPGAKKRMAGGASPDPLSGPIRPEWEAPGSSGNQLLEATDGGPPFYLNGLGQLYRAVQDEDDRVRICYCRDGEWQKDPGCAYHRSLLAVE